MNALRLHKTAEFTPEHAEAVIGPSLVTTEHLDLKLAEVRRDIADSKSDILRWMFMAMAAQTGLIVALVKLIH